jgi:hypothetical protein
VNEVNAGIIAGPTSIFEHSALKPSFLIITTALSKDEY